MEVLTLRVRMTLECMAWVPEGPLLLGKAS